MNHIVFYRCMNGGAVHAYRLAEDRFGHSYLIIGGISTVGISLIMNWRRSRQVKMLYFPRWLSKSLRRFLLKRL